VGQHVAPLAVQNPAQIIKGPTAPTSTTLAVRFFTVAFYKLTNVFLAPFTVTRPTSQDHQVRRVLACLSSWVQPTKAMVHGSGVRREVFYFVRLSRVFSFSFNQFTAAPITVGVLSEESVSPFDLLRVRHSLLILWGLSLAKFSHLTHTCPQT